MQFLKIGDTYLRFGAIVAFKVFRSGQIEIDVDGGDVREFEGHAAAAVIRFLTDPKWWHEGWPARPFSGGQRATFFDVVAEYEKLQPPAEVSALN